MTVTSREPQMVQPSQPLEVVMVVVFKVVWDSWLQPPSLSCIMPSMQLSLLVVEPRQFWTSSCPLGHPWRDRSPSSFLISDKKALSIQEKFRLKYMLDLLVEELLRPRAAEQHSCHRGGEQLRDV